MSSSFSIALSGLEANSEAIDITGNNLANMNTTGFKGSEVDFKDLVSQSYGSSAEVGLGVGIPTSNRVFSQGTVATNQSALAAAIQGNGFFVVKQSSGQQLYTRDGNFTLDSDGVLKTQTGEAVQGWMATKNGIDTNGTPTDITVQIGQGSAPQATSTFTINANLDAAGVAGTSTGTFSAPVSVVDSLGATHDLTVTFTQSSSTANTWTYNVTMPGADLTAGTAGTQSTLATGTLSFNSDGTMVIPSGSSGSVAIPITGLADGAADMNLSWAQATNGTGNFTQYAQASASNSITQDGSAGSELDSVAIESGGQIVATYSDGETKVEAQLAMASITNPNSLQNAGDNNLSATGQTSTPVIGVANTGGLGQIQGSALESSTVDMASQFTNLITYQSGYQACSRIISTANTMNQDLFNLIH